MRAHPLTPPRRPASRLALAMGAGLLLTTMLGACDDASEPAGDEETTAVEAAATSPAETPPSPEDRPEASEAFLAWLEASREPDTTEACAALTDALVERMLAEMAEDGYAGVDSCEEMIEMTAELYRALDSSAEVTIDVQEATEAEALLFVTYVESGDCGMVAMSWQDGRWMITEQTEGCDEL